MKDKKKKKKLKDMKLKQNAYINHVNDPMKEACKKHLYKRWV